MKELIEGKASRFSILGKALPRVDAGPKVTGEAKYAHDISLPQMLYGKILRSPLPHARLAHIDCHRAVRLPGVKGIITGKDTLGLKYGMFLDRPESLDECGLAMDKVRYIGDEVAAVAAVDGDIAEEALSLIQVEYQELPAVFEPLEAMEEGAPKIHEGENNIGWQVKAEFGQVERGFEESDYVREDQFVTQLVIHCSLESHASVASYDGSGRLTLWASTQTPYYLKRDLARLLGISIGRIQVVRTHVGGAFGGKGELSSTDFCAALLSMRTGRPVKIVYARDEEFGCTRRRHPMIIKLKTGVTKDGRLAAQDCLTVADGGAYNSMGPGVIGRAGSHLTMQYVVPNFRYQARLVYTNKPVCGAFRGFGFLQACFANESQLDMIARDLGIDPVALRAMNAVKSGYVNPLGYRITSCGLKECLLKVVKMAVVHQQKERPLSSTKRRGVGIAASSYICGNREHPSEAWVELAADGAVKLFAGAAEIGQGSDTALGQIAAEVLGIPPQDITIISSDSDVVLQDLGSFASRTTTYVGSAVAAAATHARDQLVEIIAEKWEVHPRDVQCRDNKIFVMGSLERGLAISEAIKNCVAERNGVPLWGRGYFKAEDCTNDPVSLQGNIAPAYSYGALAAEVEVDTETGCVRIIKTWSAFDCGRVINIQGIQGQVEGSVAMGAGQALYEEVCMDQGFILNPEFGAYRVPTSLDVPEICSDFVESVDPVGPFGAKGVSEGTQLPVAPAIANAIHDAVGVRIKELPVTPAKLFNRMEGAERRQTFAQA